MESRRQPLTSKTNISNRDILLEEDAAFFIWFLPRLTSDVGLCYHFGVVRVGFFILMVALTLSAGAKHYSFVGGYPSTVSEARAKSTEQNAGVKSDVTVKQVTTVKKEKKMSTKCRYCGSTSYGVGCAHSPLPNKKHEHRDDEKHCEWCGSSSYGVGCPHSPMPNRKHRHGPGSNKCIWCGSTSNGVGCPHSPTGRHEK